MRRNVPRPAITQPQKPWKMAVSCAKQRTPSQPSPAIWTAQTASLLPCTPMQTACSPPANTRMPLRSSPCSEISGMRVTALPPPITSLRAPQTMRATARKLSTTMSRPVATRMPKKNWRTQLPHSTRSVPRLPARPSTTATGQRQYMHLRTSTLRSFPTPTQISLTSTRSAAERSENSSS